MKPKVTAIIQARMGSYRLPEKTMADILGQPMLHYVITRTLAAKTVEQVVVATTEKPQDSAISDFCQDYPVMVFRGNETDLLDRYFRAATALDADPIVRITADCPLIDPEIIDKVVTEHIDGGYDLTANGVTPEQRTYPDGLDVGTVSYAALVRAWVEATTAYDREHLSPYISRNPQRFSQKNIKTRPNRAHMRWTVDYPEDLEFVRAVFAGLGKSLFGMKDVLMFLQDNPKVFEINAHKSIYDKTV